MTARTLKFNNGTYVKLEDADPEEVIREAQHEYYQIQPSADAEIEQLFHSNFLRRMTFTDYDETHELCFD